MTSRRLDINQRIFCIQEIIKGTPYTTIQQLFGARYPGVLQPSYKCLYNLKKKFEQHGTLQNRQRDGSGRPSTGMSLENALATWESVEEQPDISTRRRSAMLDIPRTTLQRVLRKELGLYPYRITKKHALLPRDVPARLRMANWYLRKDAADDDFVQNIWFTDEANFHLVGSVNSHNAVHWGSERPDQVQQVPLHSPKLVVWCAISAHGLIGPYFFKDQNGATTTVNSTRYHEMLRRFFVPELYNFCTAQDLDPFLMYFMQDGARAHVTRTVQDYLQDQFGGRTIGENLAEHWPARSPDLTPCDFFLWGWMKEEVYKRMPFADLNGLEAAIRDVCRSLPSEMCHKACHSTIQRFEELKNRGGQHIEHLL